MIPVRQGRAVHPSRPAGGGAYSTSWLSSSGKEEKGIDNGGDRRGEDPKEEEDHDDVFPGVAATQKTTAQSYSKNLSSLIKTSTSPRKSSLLPGYSLGQLPKHRRHMVSYQPRARRVLSTRPRFNPWTSRLCCEATEIGRMALFAIS